MENYNTSQTLLYRLQESGSEQDWIRFNQEYRPFIYSLVAKFSINNEDCEELTQDVLIKIWKALPDFLYLKKRCRFRTWLAKVTRNTSLNFLNSAKNRRSQDQVTSEDNMLLLGCSGELDEREEKEWQLFITRKAWTNIQDKFSSDHLEIYAKMLKGTSATTLAEQFKLEVNSVYKYRKRIQAAMNRELRALESELDG